MEPVDVYQNSSNVTATATVKMPVTRQANAVRNKYVDTHILSLIPYIQIETRIFVIEARVGIRYAAL